MEPGSGVPAGRAGPKHYQKARVRDASEAMRGSGYGGYGKRAGPINAILGDLAGMLFRGAEALLRSQQQGRLSVDGVPSKTPVWPSSRVPPPGGNHF